MVDNNELSYAAKESRQYDHDRWLTALFAPSHLRENLFSLIAFNTEISRIRETVSEPMIGDIRLQWWREAIESLGKGKPRAHPVIDALSKVQTQFPLNFSLMQEMIDARSKDLDAAPIEDDAGLIAYADGTGGGMQRLMLSIVAPDYTPLDDEAALQAGRCFALVGIIRAIPFHAQNDLLLLPQSRLVALGLTADTVFKVENRKAFLKIVEDIAEIATRELSKARQAARRASSKAKTTHHLNALTALYLKKLKGANFDPGHPDIKVGSPRKILALVLRNMKKG